MMVEERIRLGEMLSLMRGAYVRDATKGEVITYKSELREIGKGFTDLRWKIKKSGTVNTVCS